MNGNDLLAVRGAAARAIERARHGQGPSFIECFTHRMRGHYEGDPAKYRELSQLSEWKKKDPIARFTRELQRQKLISSREIEAAEREARDLVDKAAEFALVSPWPGPDEVASQVTA